MTPHIPLPPPDEKGFVEVKVVHWKESSTGTISRDVQLRNVILIGVSIRNETAQQEVTADLYNLTDDNAFPLIHHEMQRAALYAVNWEGHLKLTDKKLRIKFYNVAANDILEYSYLFVRL